MMQLRRVALLYVLCAVAVLSCSTQQWPRRAAHAAEMTASTAPAPPATSLTTATAGGQPMAGACPQPTLLEPRQGAIVATPTLVLTLENTDTACLDSRDIGAQVEHVACWFELM